MKKVLGAAAMIACAAALGLVLYLLLPPAVQWVDGKTRNAGPLGLLVLLIMLPLAMLLAAPFGRMTQWFDFDGNYVMGAVCGLLAGLPTTIVFGARFFAGYYETWTGLGYVICGGLAVIGFVFMLIVKSSDF